MGKIRIKTLGLEEEEKKQAEKVKIRRAEKIARAKSEQKEEPEVEKPVKKAKVVKEKESVEEPEVKKDDKKSTKEAVRKVRGAAYLKAKKLVEKKDYPVAKAVQLLKKMDLFGFDQTVELHINTNIESLKGEASLPHGTGKKVKVAVVDDKVITAIEAGKIDFDVLIATPTDMPKLVKFAKILGPRGLMPNPKNGTVTAKPEEAVKKFSSGSVRFKTEAKAPIIHQSVGKMSFKDDQLIENIDIFIKAVASKNITSIFLKATMTPSIRIKVE